MDVTAAQVKQLRDKTGVGMMDCKKALAETAGDMDKAIEMLRKRGEDVAAKRQGRATGEGRIGSYVHMNKIGVMVELRCETDFVANNEEFQALLKDLCLQVCATNPLAVDRDSVPEDILEKERQLYAEQFAGKPEQIRDKILEGKLKSFYEDNCLIEQVFVRNPDITMQDRLNEVVAKLGEKIVVARFVRIELGEDS